MNILKSVKTKMLWTRHERPTDRQTDRQTGGRGDAGTREAKRDITNVKDKNTEQEAKAKAHINLQTSTWPKKS